VYGFGVGFVLDAVGVRSSLLVGALLSAAAKATLALATAPWLVYVALYVAAPLGEALCIPVLTTAVRRYTRASQRALAYGLFYSTMNMGSVCAGWGIDLFRLALPARTNVDLGLVVRLTVPMQRRLC